MEVPPNKKDFKHKCELRLLVCEPNPFRPDRVTVGFVLRDTSGETPRVEVRLARNLRSVRCIYPPADLEAIEAVLLEIEPILRSVTDVEGYLRNMPADGPADFSFLPGQALLTNSMDDEIDLLTQQYLTLAKRPARSEVQEGEDGGEIDGEGTDGRNRVGRPYLLRKMNEAFRPFSLWNVLQKEIAIARYTHKGDPLKIDFGYRDAGANTYRMMHAVSVVLDVDKATNLALRWPRLRDGVISEGSGSCELYGIVEDPKYRQAEATRSALEFLQDSGVLVRPVSDMPQLVAEAARTLNL